MNSLWKVKGEGRPVLEVWEAVNGDLYFITEKQENGDIFCFARLYSMPQFAEWGWNNIDYLISQYGRSNIWRLRRSAWPNINSYEENLLVRAGGD